MTFNQLSSCHGDDHVLMVVSFVVLDFVCGSSGCVLWLCVCGCVLWMCVCGCVCVVFVGVCDCFVVVCLSMCVRGCVCL